MRGRNNRRREAAKHGRRLLLAGLLVATGQVAKADGPVAMVPLPLTPLESEQAGVRSNPFCQPIVIEAVGISNRYSPASVKVERPQGIYGSNELKQNLFAQGQTESGAVILTSGGDTGELSGRSDGGQGLRSYLQTAASETGGGVRANPLAAAFKVTEPPEPKADVRGVRAIVAASQPSDAVSFSLSDDDDASTWVVDRAGSTPVQLSFNDESAMSLEQDAVVKFGNVGRPETASSTIRQAKPWKFDGGQQATQGGADLVNLRALEPQQFAAGRILLVPQAGDAEPDMAVADNATSAPVALSDPEAGNLLPAGLMPDDTRLVNGGRPRVEVGRPPVAVDRMATMSIVPGKPRVLMVEAKQSASVVPSDTATATGPELAQGARAATATPAVVLPTAKLLKSVVVSQENEKAVSITVSNTVKEPDSPVFVAPKSTEMEGAGAGAVRAVAIPAATKAVEQVEEPILASYSLKPTEVRAITLGSAVMGVHSDNLAVCSALKGPVGQVQLIATGLGTTRLSVHTVGVDGTEKVDRYQVSVSEERSAAMDSPGAIAITLTQTVQTAFPGSNIVVTAEAGRLVVSGSCTDEESARRMLRMIRSACSIPVVDRVKVR